MLSLICLSIVSWQATVKCSYNNQVAFLGFESKQAKLYQWHILVWRDTSQRINLRFTRCGKHCWPCVKIVNDTMSIILSVQTIILEIQSKLPTWLIWESKKKNFFLRTYSWNMPFLHWKSTPLSLSQNHYRLIPCVS